jgi:hypothetical protein
MNEEETKRKLEILAALKRRKHERELQLAQLGVNADPVVKTEIEDINKQIISIEQTVKQMNLAMIKDRSGDHRGRFISMHEIAHFMEQDREYSIEIKSEDDDWIRKAVSTLISDTEDKSIVTSTKREEWSTKKSSSIRRRQNNVLSNIIARLEYINREIHRLSSKFSMAHSTLQAFLATIASSSSAVRIDRYHSDFVLYCDKNRLFIPDDVYSLIQSYNKTFFPNDTLRADIFYKEHDLPSQLEQHMRVLVGTMRKYID